MDCLPEITDEFISCDYETPSYLFAIKPTRLDEIPEIDDAFINTKYVKKMTKETIRKYFDDMLSGNQYVCYLDGLCMYVYTPAYRCDYCKMSVNSKKFRTCYHCYKDMCNLCWNENDEATAIKNGAKNYKKRENELNECKKHNNFTVRNFDKYLLEDINCKLCDEQICVPKMSYFYSKLITNNMGSSYNVCSMCYENENKIDENCKLTGKQYVEKYGLELKNNLHDMLLFSITDFHSMLYWVPLIETTNKYGFSENSHILINLNPDDSNYKKLCLRTSYDCKSGYYIIHDTTVTLENLLERLKKITDRGKYDVKESVKVEEGIIEKYDEKRGDITWHLSKYTKEPVYKTVIKEKEFSENNNYDVIKELMTQFNMKIYY